MTKCTKCGWIGLTKVCAVCQSKAELLPQRPTWDDIFFNIADAISYRSDDPHTKLGCVITTQDHTILSMGFNGLPRGIKPTPELLNRPDKYSYMEHAERNAIYNARTSLVGARLYVQMFPCTSCARAIIQKGISEIVVGKTQSENPNWDKEMKTSIRMFEEANVKWRMQE